MPSKDFEFCQQFLVLLWKNWTIKKRHYWITIFELLTPLVLFVILIGVRRMEPIEKRGGTNFVPRPLPSSGMVAVLQEFCPSTGGRDKYGYPRLPRSKIKLFLNDLHHIWSNASIIRNGTDIPTTLIHLNESWANATRSADQLNLLLDQQSSQPLHKYLKNSTEFSNYLQKNFNLTKNVTDDILNRNINITPLLVPFNQGNLPSASRRKRDLFSSFTSNKPFQSFSKFSPDESSQNSGASSELHLKTLAPFVNLAIYAFPGVLSNNLTNIEMELNEQKISAIEEVIFSPEGLYYIICDSDGDLFLKSNNSTSLNGTKSAICMNQSSDAFRNLSKEVLSQLNQSAIIDALSRSSTPTTDDLSRQNQIYVQNLLQDLKQIQTFTKYLDILVEIAKVLPSDSCQKYEGNVEFLKGNLSQSVNLSLVDVSPSPYNTTHSNRTIGGMSDLPVHNLKIHFDKTSSGTKKKATIKKMNADDYLNIWSAFQPILCGGDSSSKYNSLSDLPSIANSSKVHLTGVQKRNLGILFHVFTSNPKILYAPNNTQVDSVIQKANTTFGLIDDITHAADVWRNVSSYIVQSLKDPQVVNTLEWLSSIKKMYKKSPQVVSKLTSGHVGLRDFLMSNDSIPNRTEIVDQLQVIDSAACGWKQLVEGISINWFKGFKTEDEAVEYATEKAFNDGTNVFCTLIFEVDENGTLPRHIRYKIRQNASLTQDTNSIRLSYWRPDPLGWDYRYYQFGFVWIQDLIERSLIWEYVGRDVVTPGAYVHHMPFPCYKFDAFALNLQHIMPLAMILSWVYTVAMLVQHIVYEKELRLKEVMKIMGLSNGVHWLAWFISIFLQLEVSVTVIALLMKFGSILPNSNLFIIWLFFSVYAAATIMFCFLVSVLFSKAKVASACSGIIYFITYLPFAYLSIQEFLLHQSISVAYKHAASLLSTTAFGLGAKYFAVYELSGYGIQWGNIGMTPVEGDNFNLLKALYMLVVDIFIYAFLTWYIEAVFPGQYGLPRPWYFPFTLSYWIGHGATEIKSFNFRRLWRRLTLKSAYSSLMEERQDAATTNQNDCYIEPVPKHLKLGIRIENLSKVYKNGKKAVDNLSLSLYQDQITSFLGHNGAGKTTTMSILTGLMPPSHGTAYIYDQDIRSDMLEIRKSLGMCPQHNVLFDVLTVEEHLWFYARLKGVSSNQIATVLDEFLKDIGLYVKRKSKINTLSGGMKRKLSVAIAFVGGSSTVILDEPTAGVDPYARRAIWDLIIKYKEGRTILLSTHHMDEADQLGDRIAIISCGKLRCCGSSLFLKSTYGDGYNLTLVKKVNDYNDDTVALSEHPTSSVMISCSKIKEVVRSYINTAKMTYDSSNQISFNLPFSAVHNGCFHKLLDDLPNKMKSLNITSYGLTATTLEEVFLKVGSDRKKLEKKPDTCESDSVVSYVQHQKTPQPVQPAISYGDISLQNQGNSNNVDVPLGWLKMTSNTFNSAQSTQQATSGLLSEEHYPLHPSSSDLHKNCYYERLPLEDHPTDDSTSNSSIKLEQDRESQLNGSFSQNDYRNVKRSRNVNQTGFIHDLRILQALLIKRFHYARRSRKAIFYQIMLPGLFVFIAMTVALSLPSADDPPALELSPAQYYNITQPRGNFMPYTDQSAIFPVTRSAASEGEADTSRIIDTFSLPSGIGSTCVLKNKDVKFYVDLNPTVYSSVNKELLLQYFNPECRSCFTRETSFSSQYLPPISSQIDPNLTAINFTNMGAPCVCVKEGNTYICSQEYGIFPVTRTVVTGDKLIDITGKEPIMPYLRYTTNNYRLHRYGGLSFSEFRSQVDKSFPGWPTPLRKIAVRDTAQIFFNHKGFHSMPTYLNVFNNALLRANLPASKGTPASYGITVINHPMNKTAGALSMDYLLSGTDVVIAVFIIVAMSFIPASFLVFLVIEKESKAKHLQFISGTGPFTYWLSNYIWDMLNYFFPAALCISILLLFNLPAYSRGSNAYAVIALFFLYGWSMTPMMYPASFYFDVPSTAYVCMIVINLFVGITTVVTTFMISLFRDNASLQTAYKYLQVAFLIFPNYNLGRGLMDLSYYEYMNGYYAKLGQYDQIHNIFEWDIITRQLVAMAVQGVAFFILTLLFEVRFFIRSRNNRFSFLFCDNDTDNVEDEDVTAERRRVNSLKNLNRHEDLIVVDNISKAYTKRTNTTLAVNRLSFGVRSGECFGLLGVNGAGKTTTFHTITGTLNVSDGKIRVAGHQVTGSRSTERLSAQQATGYCPQFDAIFNELTPSEHLHLFARLRGIPRQDEKKVVEQVIDQLNLTSHKNKPVRELSGGNKRKLSVAIALVGNPPVVLLDEPTAGMDPAARRFLWDLIIDVTRSGRAVLLTSHSMEECEVLCHRIAIMVNGKFKCLGPPQHLKNRFGDGYMISVRSPEPRLFVDAFSSAYSSVILKELHYHKAAFQLPLTDRDKEVGVSLAEVFKMLEDRRNELMIEDYSVSQTTLDDVFINFVKKQGENSQTVIISKTKLRKFFGWLRRKFLSLRRVHPGVQSIHLDTNGLTANLIQSTSCAVENITENEESHVLYDFDQNMTLAFHND